MAVVAPRVVALRLARGSAERRVGSRPCAESEILDVRADIEREPLAARPVVDRTPIDHRILVARMGGQHQSTFAPESLMTLLHFTISVFRNALSSSGLPPTTSKPSAVMRSRSSGARITFTISVLSFVILGRGVPAGAKTAN